MTGLVKTYYSVRVAETDLSRKALAEKAWISNEKAVRVADVIALPWHELQENEGPIFPQGTADLIKFLSGAGLGPIGLPVRESDYVELAMHGKAWRLPTIFLTIVAVPVLVNIVSNRLDEMLPGFEDDDTVHFEMIVERPHSPCISIKYEGPADRLPETILKESQRCFEAPKTSP